jgi:exodeoxyribonuclease V alpha subunit
MTPAVEAPTFLRRLFPAASPDLMLLFAQAAEQAGMLHVDFCTIRDLVELSDYQTDETLHAWLLVLLLALDEGSLCVEVSEAAVARRLADLVDDELARVWARQMVAAFEAGPRNGRPPEGGTTNQTGWPALIGTEVSADRPIVLYGSAGRRFLYFQKYLAHEQVFLAALRQRLGGADLVPALAGLKDILAEVLRPAGRKPIVLNRRQQEAVALALLRNITVISGGPGTGKTSIVFTLLRCLLRCGIAPERIALAAPTGRAAQRLTDAVRAGLERLDPSARSSGPEAALQDLTAQTLHQTLGYQPLRGTFRQHAENPLAADVVIVDEVSMVGLVLMTRLFDALAPQTRLILLGDKDQLPSVEAGALLAHLIPESSQPRFSEEVSDRLATLLPAAKKAASPEKWAPISTPALLRDTLVILEENYRSQKDIQEAAAAVNRQDTSIVDRLPQFGPEKVASSKPDAHAGETPPATFSDLARRGGCWWLDMGDGSVGQWRDILGQWAEHQFGPSHSEQDSYGDLVARCRLSGREAVSSEEKSLLDRLFAILERGRVLTLLREGPWGGVAVNRLLEQLLRPRLDGRASTLFAGAPVLITRNDHVRRLYNGDVGIALRSPGGLRVVFARQDGYLGYPADSLPAHELAFALTVHKSQGSEYGQVLLALPPTGGRRLLTKELLYTGITRARDLAVICGTREALGQAIRRKVERESALLRLAATPRHA